MTRERTVDLAAYLPPFMAEYKEISAALTAENPEFEISRDAANRILDNEFVITADEYGIARFEKLLQLLPDAGDSLETRRARILALLARQHPYTIAWLSVWLDGLCGQGKHRETVEDYTFGLWLDGGALIGAHLTAADIIGMLSPVLSANLTWCVTTTLEMERTLYLGGNIGMQSKWPIPENRTAPAATTILRAGGVTTILSNISKGD